MPTATTMMATPLPETPDAPPKDELRPALVYGESATRSFVKALAWRLTAGVVTLVRGTPPVCCGGGGVTVRAVEFGRIFFAHVYTPGLPFQEKKERKGTTITTTLLMRSSSTDADDHDACHRMHAAPVEQISGLVFSGSLSTAMSIVGSDFVTKSGFMFAGERVWNKVGRPIKDFFVSNIDVFRKGMHVQACGPRGMATDEMATFKHTLRYFA